MRHQHLSVKWKLFLYFTLFSCVILVLLWLFQTVFLDSFYKTIKKHEVHKYTQVIEKNIDSDTIESFLQSLSQENGLCVLVLDSEGSTLYSADAQMGCIIHKLDAEGLYRFYQLAKNNNGEYVEQFESKKNDYAPGQKRGEASASFHPVPRMMESIVEVRTFTDAKGKEIILYVNSVISPVSATVSTLRIQLIWITVLMIALALMIALILARKIARPVEKMNASAKMLAQEHYDVKFEGGSYREIDELAQTLTYTAHELSRVEELRRELMANISHDLRTPLTMITGYGEMMRDVPGENNAENIEVIIGEAKRLTTLVNDVLDLTKLQSQEPLHLYPFDITDEIEMLIHRYDKLAPEYQISFHHAEDHVMVKADKVRILQVVYNLINNAITYTGEDKTVMVNQIVKDGYVCIHVLDTGTGISPEELRDIWQRYYRSSVHKRATVGTGLGLSIVRSVIDMHNTIEPGMADCGVESTVGKGSDFWFQLRLHEE